MKTRITIGILCGFICCFVQQLHGQPHPGFSKLFRYSGDQEPRADYISTLLFDSSQQSLYFTLSALSEVSFKASAVFYKTDLLGNVIAERLDTFTNGSVHYQSVAETSDHQFLIWGGACFERVTGALSKWKLVKTDKDLNVIWERYIETGAADAVTLSIKMLPDSGHMMLLCRKNSPADPPHTELPSRIILRKVDSLGNLIEEFTPGPSYYNIPVDMQVTRDGGYLICGRTFSWGQTNGTAFSLKTDSLCAELGHELYAQQAPTCWTLGMTGSGEADEYYFTFGQVAVTNDVAVGFINKIDADGGQIWYRQITFANKTDGLFDAAATDNGAIVACGTSYPGDENYTRGWLVNLDKDGNERWQKLHTAHPRPGDQEYLYNIVRLPDGSFVAGGSSWGQDENARWTQDGWLLRVDSNGCVTPNCSGDVRIRDIPGTDDGITLFPNPSKGTFFLQSEKPFHRNTTVTLMNSIGQQLRELPVSAGTTRETYPLDGFPDGVYFLRIVNDRKVTLKKISLNTGN